jgi:hypothetical protein
MKPKRFFLLIPSVEATANISPDLAYEALTTELITYPQLATAFQAYDPDYAD